MAGEPLTIQELIPALQTQTDALIQAIVDNIQSLIDHQILAAVMLAGTTHDAADTVAEVQEEANDLTVEYRRIKTLADYYDDIQK